MKKSIIAIVCCTIALCTTSTAQVYLLTKAELIDRSTRNFVSIEQPAAASSSVRLIFPTAAGAVNDALFVKSVSGTDVTLDWAATSSSTSTTLSSRITADQTTTAIATPTAGVSVAISANKAYRWFALFRCNRVAGAGSDNFRTRITVPTGTSFMSMGVRSTCITTSTGVPLYTSATTGTQLTSTDINPAGATNDVGNARCYYAEGLVITGSSSGNIQLQVIQDSGASAGNLTIYTNGNLIVQEIQ
ncbi:MAG: hypothetical protein RL594_1397 [Bacteroidota bacterium]